MKKSPSAQRHDASRARSGGGMLLGLFLGLVIGMLVAFGVVWYLNKAKLPFQDKYEGAPPAQQHPATVPGEAPLPLPLPGKPGDKVGDKPRFDFYGILEGKQPANQVPAPAANPPVLPVPQPAVSAPAPVQQALVPAQAAVAKPAPVYLQAGAFQKPADAENLKARLALQGMEASVQTVELPDKGTMHRVRVGPFRSAEDVADARARLTQSGVATTVVKP